MGELDSLNGWEELGQTATQRGEDLCVRIEPGLDTGAEMIRRSPTAEDDPVVHRALAVHDHVPMLTERLGIGQSDLVPGRLRQGCGGHDQ